LGIKLRALDSQHCLSFESESGMIGDDLADTASAAATDLGMRSSSVFTYLANSIRGRGRDVPYSLVTAVDERALKDLWPGISSQPAPSVLKHWGDRDLGVRDGDPIELEYYVWLPEGRLATRNAQFQLAG